MDRIWLDIGGGVTVETPRPREEAEIVAFLMKASQDEAVTTNTCLPPNLSLEGSSAVYKRYNALNLLFAIRIFGELAGIFSCLPTERRIIELAHLEQVLHFSSTQVTVFIRHMLVLGERG